MNPGSKSAGFAWLLAFIAVGAALGVNALAAKIGLGSAVTYGLYVGIIGVCGYLSTFLTKAGAGMAILAFLVASIGMAVGAYMMVSSAASAAISTVSTTGATANGVSAADAKLAADAAGGAIGAIAGIFVAVVSFLVTFFAGMTGALIGNGAKKKKIAATPELARAAA